MELVEIRPGDTVAVTGAGPIGMLCAAMARLAGASRVWACDPVPHRLKLAMDMGAHQAVAPARLRELVMDETRGRGADAVFDAAGMESSVNLALALARTAGAVVLIGLPGQLKLAIDVYEIMNKELRVVSLKRSNHKGAGAAKLLEQGLIPRSLITHCLPLEAAPRAFSLLEHYDDGAGKVVIEVA
jgi:threonine dehydrogenase-like Zn-dependent dehydrogenase